MQLFQPTRADLEGRCKGEVSFWLKPSSSYSLLKSVNLSSQLHHALVVHPPPPPFKKYPGSASDLKTSPSRLSRPLANIFSPIKAQKEITVLWQKSTIFLEVSELQFQHANYIEHSNDMIPCKSCLSSTDMMIRKNNTFCHGQLPSPTVPN